MTYTKFSNTWLFRHEKNNEENTRKNLDQCQKLGYKCNPNVRNIENVSQIQNYKTEGMQLKDIGGNYHLSAG